MKLEDFENLTNEELRGRARQCFEDAPNVDLLVSTILLPKARFYLDEIERRRDHRISVRDFRMEWTVIALIGLELLAAVGLAVWGERIQTAQVQKQLDAIGQVQRALSNLDTSSQATADTLVAVKGSMEDMNRALQKELALSYEVSLIPVWDASTKKISFSNTGRTNVFLWGTKFSDGPILIEDSRTVSPSGTYTIDAGIWYEQISQRVPKGIGVLVPVNFYVKNDRGEEFVQHFFAGTSWKDDILNLALQVVNVEPEDWTKLAKRKSTISGKAP